MHIFLLVLITFFYPPGSPQKNIRKPKEHVKIGISNDCQCSDHEVDEIESIDSQQSMTNFDDLSVDVLN